MTRVQPDKPKKQPDLKSFALKYLPLAFYVLLIVFLILYVKSIDFNKLRGIHFVWTWAIIASIFGLLTRYWGAFIWFVLLSKLGAKDLKKSSVQLTYVYAKSWLGRYIPGTAPWILGKIYFASKHGIPKDKLAVSSLLEGALQIVVLMAMSFLMLISDPRLDVLEYGLKVTMSFILLGCLIALAPPVFNFFIKTAVKLLKKPALDKENHISNRILIDGALLYAIGAIINGLSLFFIAKAVYPGLGYDTLLFVMAAGNLAGAVGMLAIFVPSGIGVREGVQLVLLSLIMPTEVALLVTIVTRLWGVVIDLIFFGACALTRSYNKS